MQLGVDKRHQTKKGEGNSAGEQCYEKGRKKNRELQNEDKHSERENDERNKKPRKFPGEGDSCKVVENRHARGNEQERKQNEKWEKNREAGGGKAKRRARCWPEA